MRFSKHQYERLYALLDVIKKKGCDIAEAYSLLENNPVLFDYEPFELDEKLSFIMNHDLLYAALLVNGNYYEWSLYKDRTFSPFQSKTIFDENRDDFVIDMVVDFIYYNKFYLLTKYILLPVSSS